MSDVDELPGSMRWVPPGDEPDVDVFAEFDLPPLDLEPERPAGSVTWRDLFASRRYQGIKCWHGTPGSGKTYELARWGLQQQAEGRELWCSYGFELPGCKTFRSVDEFVNIPKHSAVCVDEAPIWFDARAWSAMDRSVLLRVTQIRHSDIHLRYTAIHPSMVELRLRQITFEFWRCSNLASRGPWNVLVRSKSPDGAPQLHERPGWPTIRLMRPEVCAAYDTTADADTTDWVDFDQAKKGRRK